MHNIFFIRKRFPNHHVRLIAILAVLSCLILGLGLALLFLMTTG